MSGHFTCSELCCSTFEAIHTKFICKYFQLMHFLFPKDNTKLSIHYSAGEKNNILTRYVGANFASDVEDRKSKTSFVPILNAGVVV